VENPEDPEPHVGAGAVMIFPPSGLRQRLLLRSLYVELRQERLQGLEKMRISTKHFSGGIVVDLFLCGGLTVMKRLWCLTMLWLIHNFSQTQWGDKICYYLVLMGKVGNLEGTELRVE